MWLPHLRQAHLDMLERARLRAPEDQPVRGRSLICGFRLERQQRAVPRLRFRFVDGQGWPMPQLSSGVTNEEGEGLVFCDRRSANAGGITGAVLHTSPLESDDWTAASGPITFPTSGRLKQEHEGGWTFYVFRDIERPRRLAGSTPDQARVAIAGRPEDLEKVIPYFRGRTCTRIGALVVRGDPDEVTTPGWLRVTPMAADDLELGELRDLTAVIDLTGLAVFDTAWERRFRGEVDSGPIVLKLSPHSPDFDRLLGFFERRFTSQSDAEPRLGPEPADQVAH